jgi:biotin carboxyl carrier protein
VPRFDTEYIEMRTNSIQQWLSAYCDDRDGIAGGLVILPAPPAGAPGVAAAWPGERAGDESLFAAAKDSLDTCSPIVKPATPKEGAARGPAQVIALPVRSGRRTIGAIALEIVSSQPERVQAALDEIVQAAAGLESAFDAQDRQAVTAGTDIAALLRIQAAVLSRDGLAEAATAFACELAAGLKLDRVCIGLLDDETVDVIALSNRGEAQEHASLLRWVSDAMAEAIEQSGTIIFPALEKARPCITLAHAELARRQGSTVCTIPLVAGGRVFGALSLERTREHSLDADVIAACEHIVCLVAPVLRLHHANERPWHKRLWDAASKGWGRMFGPGNLALKSGVLALLATIAGLLLIPVDYWIGATARLEGSVQRVLVAPVDGFIKQVMVRPGDKVGTEQVLVELAEKDLQLERRKWESELRQHENAQQAALARAERAQYVMNEGKAEAARAQLTLIEQQLARARIRAPFDGIVIKGDLTQSLGAPVQRGEVLLTVAPANEFRLIVEVDERDIPGVQAGADGALALAALPHGKIGFQVARITPVAIARDGRNFFEVEGILEAMPASVQPGLQGVAKIHAGRRSLAWIWTHRLTDWMRLTFWSWRI